MLTQTLRKLEQRGLLNRLVHPVVPPHVDYSLTPAGNKLAEAVALLCGWAEQNKALLKQVHGTEVLPYKTKLSGIGASTRSFQQPAKARSNRSAS